MGAGMEEIYQITSALKHLPFGKHVAVVTDARFSGVSTGACIGHVGPEALAGGPIGKVRDGDLHPASSSTATGWKARVDLVGDGERRCSAPRRGRAILAAAAPRPDLAPDPDLPDDTRLWAALQRRRRRHLGRLRLRSASTRCGPSSTTSSRSTRTPRRRSCS